MTRRPEHICWGKEPWFAWDLWNEVPGAPLLLDAMLNGSFARTPIQLELEIGGHESKALLPSVTDLSPVLGDYLPITTGCGLWVGWLTSGDTILSFDNENGCDHKATILPLGDDDEYIDGYYGVFWRPWNVELLQDASEDNADEFDEGAQWINANVTFFEDGDRFDQADLDRIYQEFAEVQHKQRQEWHHFLKSMAPRHTCAELMLAELEEEMGI